MRCGGGAYRTMISDLMQRPIAHPLLRNVATTFRYGPSNESFADRPNRHLSAVFDRELAEDVLHVFLDGFHADLQRFADFAVAQSEGQVTYNLRLARVNRTSSSTMACLAFIISAIFFNSPAGLGDSPAAQALITAIILSREDPLSR